MGNFPVATGAGFLPSTVLKAAVRSVSSGYCCVSGRGRSLNVYVSSKLPAVETSKLVCPFSRSKAVGIFTITPQGVCRISLLSSASLSILGRGTWTGPPVSKGCFFRRNRGCYVSSEVLGSSSFGVHGVPLGYIARQNSRFNLFLYNNHGNNNNNTSKHLQAPPTIHQSLPGNRCRISGGIFGLPGRKSGPEEEAHGSCSKRTRGWCVNRFNHELFNVAFLVHVPAELRLNKLSEKCLFSLKKRSSKLFFEAFGAVAELPPGELPFRKLSLELRGNPVEQQWLPVTPQSLTAGTWQRWFPKDKNNPFPGADFQVPC